MREVCLVPGYGIPKDIIKDGNYRFYLSIVFNTIYDLASKNYIKPVVVFSGGKTDCFKPYKRNEADEMVKFFRHFSKTRNLNNIMRKWHIISEKKSLSTLENLLNTKALLSSKRISSTNITIFCEKTREARIKKLSKKIFGKSYKVKVIPIDFDTSLNRYLSPQFIVDKEKKVLKYDLWALENPQNLKKYHKAFEEKIAFIRNSGPNNHAKAIQQWWEIKLKEIDKYRA